jgi:hypothetical protein
VTEPGGLAALRPMSRTLLERAARSGAADDQGALIALRDDLAALDDEELALLWAALNEDDEDANGMTPHDEIYRTVDKARRKLLVPADRFQDMLLAHLAEAGGAPPPEPKGRSLKALVAAFVDAGRGEEIAEAARAIVKARSFAYDIT